MDGVRIAGYVKLQPEDQLIWYMKRSGGVFSSVRAKKIPDLQDPDPTSDNMDEDEETQIGPTQNPT